MITLLVITLSGLYIKQYYCFPTIGHNQMDAMLQVQEKTRRELECVICLEVPKKEDHVFSCLEHHLICLECFKHTLQECPICRQDFRKACLSTNQHATSMENITNFNKASDFDTKAKQNQISMENRPSSDDAASLPLKGEFLF